MTETVTEADTVVAALRSGHDELAALVAGLSDADLERRSGAAEWDVAQVFSHLGSGAEISAAGVRAALGGAARPGSDLSQSVWDRWNALSRREQAEGFVAVDEELVALYESMDDQARANLRIDVGFLPQPVDVASAARIRLNEQTLHSWDIRVAFDETAALNPDAVGPLLHDTTLLGWIAKAEQLGGATSIVRVETLAPDEVFTLDLGERVGVVFDAPADPDGTLVLPAEAWLRLVAGRLAVRYTPADVRAAGAAHLDLLRRVFPGY